MLLPRVPADGDMGLWLPKAAVGDGCHGEDIADDGSGLQEFSGISKLCTIGFLLVENLAGGKDEK